jgi:hypothetical protein
MFLEKNDYNIPTPGKNLFNKNKYYLKEINKKPKILTNEFPDTIIFKKYFLNILPNDIILKIFEFYSNKEIKDSNLRDIRVKSLLQSKGELLLPKNIIKDINLVVPLYDVLAFDLDSPNKLETINSRLLPGIISIFFKDIDIECFIEVNYLVKHTKYLSYYLYKFKNLFKNKNIWKLRKIFKEYNNFLVNYLDYRSNLLFDNDRLNVEDKILFLEIKLKYLKKLKCNIKSYNDIENFVQLTNLKISNNELNQIRISNKIKIKFEYLDEVQLYYRDMTLELPNYETDFDDNYEDDFDDNYEDEDTDDLYCDVSIFKQYLYGLFDTDNDYDDYY